jgi:type IV pilus assembly protein PilO
MAMTDKEKKQAQGFAIALAVAAIGYMWFMWRAPIVVQVATLTAEMDTLRAQTDTIRTQLRSGSAEDMEARIESYGQSLDVMRQLVPDRVEVTRLLDDITDRARRRSVTTADYRPATPVDDGNYQVFSYGFTMVGTYDNLGAFISDVASLPRIMVPENLSLSLPQDGDLPPELAADSANLYLKADFNVTAFVKPPRSDVGLEPANVN